MDEIFVRINFWTSEDRVLVDYSYFIDTPLSVNDRQLKDQRFDEPTVFNFLLGISQDRCYGVSVRQCRP